MREQQGAEDKDTHKRSIVLSDYNLVFQEVVPLNVSLHPPVTKKKKQRRLRKIPLRFQEVLEVSTERSPVHFVDLSQHDAVANVHKDPEPQEVREIKRYSLQELEQKFPQIFAPPPPANKVKSRFNEVFEVRKMRTRFTPGSSAPRVKPVYPREVEREVRANTDILRDVTLDLGTGAGKAEEAGGDSLFGGGRGGKEDGTQIIISLTNHPEIRLYSTEEERGQSADAASRGNYVISNDSSMDYLKLYRVKARTSCRRPRLRRSPC